MKKTFKVLFAIATCFIFFASLLLFTRRSRASSQKVVVSSTSIDDQDDSHEFKYEFTVPSLIGEDYSKVASDKIIKTSEEYRDD